MDLASPAPKRRQGRLRLGAGGERIALHTELFLSLLPFKGAFSGIVDSLIYENFYGGKPPNPQSTIVLVGNRYIKHCSPEKEFKQNLPLLRNMFIHRFALSVSLAPLP